jgi:cytochrome P450
MADEAFDFLTAASDTAGNAMTVATHHVITNPQIYERVKRELRSRFPDPNAKLDFTELEKLPYLTAVVKEGLRQAHSVHKKNYRRRV